MSPIFYLLFMLVIFIVLMKLSRPLTVDDGPRPGYFVIRNRFTGNLAYSGQQFRTEKQALRAARKLSEGPFSAYDGVFSIDRVSNV